MTSYFHQKLSSVHPGRAEKNVLHSMFLFVYLFSLTSTTKRTFPPSYVLCCYQARMCELLKQCFLLSAAVRSVTKVGCNSIPPRKKKFQTWGGPRNQQIDVDSGQWRSNSGGGPAQSVLKKGPFTASTFPAPIRVSSNYPRPVLNPKRSQGWKFPRGNGV